MNEDEPRKRVEWTGESGQEDISNLHRLAGDKPLTDEEMVERFKQSLALARETKDVRTLIVCFELDPKAKPRAVTWFSGTPGTNFASALLGMVELLNLVLAESRNNKGAAAGVLRSLAHLAMSAIDHERHGSTGGQR